MEIIMTSQFFEMMYLFACGAHGNIPKQQEYQDLSAVISLAVQQGIDAIVISALINGIQNGNITCSSVNVSDLQLYTAGKASESITRFCRVYSIIDELEKEGVVCCTLKGLSNAVLYDDMHCRISADVDILIDENDEKKVLEILSQKGFQYTPRHKTYNETVCRHPVLGTLEVHIKPYDDLREEILFRSKGLLTEPYIKQQIPEYFEITSLGITDGLIYNVFHCLKHFLSSGVGIRQIMDILLYMKTYKSRIDWQRFTTLMHELKYDYFIQTCIKIGLDYLGFSENELPETAASQRDALKLLDDIEKGGVFGLNDKERIKFYKLYVSLSSENNSQKKLVNGSYINQYQTPFLKQLFPSVTALYQKYPYCYKHKFLIPAAWLQRLICYVLKPKQRKPAVSPVDERMALVNDLKML